MRRALSLNYRLLITKSHHRLTAVPVILYVRSIATLQPPRHARTAERRISASASLSDLNSDSGPIVDMEVTRHNFAMSLPAVKAALEDCSFFAIDCEMTGLFVKPSNNTNNGKPPAFLDDIQDRYVEMAESARSFVINQFGLSCFVWDAKKGAWAARTFNFYVFPRPFEDFEPRFLSEAGSLDFLSRCNFDFNKWIYEGVGCMPLALRNAKLNALDRARSRPDILVSKDDDVAFVDATVDTVAAWIEDGDNAPLTFMLPAVNAYQRALQYQTLRNTDFGVDSPPGFYSERVDSGDDGGRPALRLTRATPEEVAAFEETQRRVREDAVREAAAFGEVIEAMQASKKPCIGHNLSFDLAYSLGQFVRPLPPTWDEYKDRVGRYFPGGVYDTKYLAGRFPGAFPDTTLGELYSALMALGAEKAGGGSGSEGDVEMADASGGGGNSVGDVGRTELLDLLFEPEKAPEAAGGAAVAPAPAAADSDSEPEEVDADKDAGAEPLSPADAIAALFPDANQSSLPAVDHAVGFERYRSAEGTPVYAHDAGFDAWMTGAVFARLLALMQGENSAGGGDDDEYGAPTPSLAPVEPLCWRMNLSRSDMEYAALQGDDPVPARQNVLWLTELPLGEFRHGGDLNRRLAIDREAAGGSVRITLLGPEGEEALVELGTGDAEAVAAVAAAVRLAVPGCTIRDFDEFRDVKAARRAGVELGAGGSRGKRPRTAEGTTDSGEEEKGSAWPCSIM